MDGVTGQVVWSQHYASTAGVDEAALAVAVDSGDNVIYAGRANTEGHGSQIFAMKLAANDGHILWSAERGGTADADDAAWDIVIGVDDNPVLAGLVVNTGDTAVTLTRKLDGSDGSLIWESEIVDAVDDIVNRSSWLALQDNGDVVVCARAFGTNGYDVELARYAAGDGELVWQTRYDGATHGGDDVRQMIRDGAGNLIITGVQDSAWNYNYMVVKVSGTDGSLLWEAPGYDGPPGWYDVANCVAVGIGGQIIVSGLSDGDGTGWDIATVGYNAQTGAQEWVHRYDGPASQSDEARHICTANDGSIYLVGYVYEETSGKDLFTCRLQSSAASAAGRPPVAVGGVTAAWPNPFNPAVNLSFQLPQGGRTQLAVYDLRGHLVRLLVAADLPAGEHSATWDGRDNGGDSAAAGAYLVRLQSGKLVASRKVMLVE